MRNMSGFAAALAVLVLMVLGAAGVMAAFYSLLVSVQ